MEVMRVDELEGLRGGGGREIEVEVEVVWFEGGMKLKGAVVVEGGKVLLLLHLFHLLLPNISHLNIFILILLSMPQTFFLDPLQPSRRLPSLLPPTFLLLCFRDPSRSSRRRFVGGLGVEIDRRRSVVRSEDESREVGFLGSRREGGR